MDAGGATHGLLHLGGGECVVVDAHVLQVGVEQRVTGVLAAAQVAEHGVHVGGADGEAALLRHLLPVDVDGGGAIGYGHGYVAPLQCRQLVGAVEHLLVAAVAQGQPHLVAAADGREEEIVLRVVAEIEEALPLRVVAQVHP